MRLRAENALASADPARPRWALSDILDHVARVNALVTDLLAMSQTREPRRVELELAGFMEALRSRHAVEAGRRGVALTVADGSGMARFDPEMIGRVLDNLVLNALRHTVAGGAVRVAAERLPAALRFVVADGGPGVPPELRDRLFEPFGTGRAEGIGLGLAIARELAVAHGGELRMLRPGGEAEGEGAVFALDLPQDGEAACPSS